MKKRRDVLRWLKTYYGEHPDMVVVLYLRVSSRSQNHTGNLQTQERVLRAKLRRLGVRVVDCFQERKSGWLTDHTRGPLRKAVRRARQFDNAVVLAVSADRFLRNREFTTEKPDMRPTVAEFRKLGKLAGGVPLLTLLHPDRSWRRVRGFQSKWGQAAKVNKGGRHKKLKRAERKALLLPQVIQLKQDTGRGCCWIAKQIGVSSKTVWEWLQDVL